MYVHYIQYYIMCARDIKIFIISYPLRLIQRNGFYVSIESVGFKSNSETMITFLHSTNYKIHSLLSGEEKQQPNSALLIAVFRPIIAVNKAVHKGYASTPTSHDNKKPPARKIMLCSHSHKRGHQIEQSMGIHPPCHKLHKRHPVPNILNSLYMKGCQLLFNRHRKDAKRSCI